MLLPWFVIKWVLLLEHKYAIIEMCGLHVLLISFACNSRDFITDAVLMSEIGKVRMCRRVYRARRDSVTFVTRAYEPCRDEGEALA